MRILWIDVDSLRPDHLGCYGYHRRTSPTIDAIARDAVLFTNCYASDSPCLPSRTALSTGRFGIHTGVVGHGGTAAEPFPLGPPRGFNVTQDYSPFFHTFARAGYYTASVSPFAQRHAAWWFLGGLREWLNTGRNGRESADEINAAALPWLERHGGDDNWFLHVNYWDPHTPYSTPDAYGNPVEDAPPPSWLTEEIRQSHWNSYGPHSAQDTFGWKPHPGASRIPPNIASLADWKRFVDGYDVGIHYLDSRLRRLLDVLEAKGVLEETAIVITGDHGENLGELNIYGDHHTADNITPHVPFIVRWPGITDGTVNRGLFYQFDLAATVVGLAGGQVPSGWDAVAFPDAVTAGDESGRDYLALSQMAWSCQRSIRRGSSITVRTYHDGMKNFPPVMRFDVQKDPHELNNLADTEADAVNADLAILGEWHTEMMTTSIAPGPVDPMQTVLREGGPYHTLGELDGYAKRLRETGRAHHADALEARHGRSIVRQ
jgi:arylsulfatase A-like enzyme